MIKKYEKDGIRVIWNPDLCAHSRKCVQGLPNVFNAKASPWINVDGASQEKIIEQQQPPNNDQK